MADKATMTLNLTPQEMQVLTDLAKAKDLTGGQTRPLTVGPAYDRAEQSSVKSHFNSQVCWWL